MSVSINGTNGLVFNDGSTQVTSGLTGFRNRIINGDMRIDQRNSGASINATTTSGFVYTLDRWAYGVSSASKFTIQRDAGGVTPPAGFIDYLGMTSSSAYSLASSDYFFIRQAIEGLNVADLAWGTSSAKTVTLSFWARSSLTGTFGGSLRNSAINRSYPFSYSILFANTWEYKTITIPGDTTGTWLTTNGVGVDVVFSLGMGSTFSATAESWASGNFASSTGATSVVGVNGATLYITGVQFEVGSAATNFEVRHYPIELILCQRYYEIGGSSTTIHFSGNVTSAATYFASIPFRVEKRVAPTSTSTASVLNLSFPATASTVGAVSAYEMRTQRVANASAAGYFGDTWTAGAEL